jgi:glyoxylase-like metal-dependent hydrolase (beta-lactamase superfamily II)
MRTFKKILKWTGLAVLLIGIVAGTLYFIYLRPFMQKMKVVNTIQYDKELTLLISGGGNSGILTSDSLVLVIDTKMDDAAKDMYEKVKQLAGTRPILVVNTHFHPDHIGGNSFYKGSTILAGANYGKEGWIKEAGEASLPTQWLKDRMTVPMGNDTVTILNFNMNAHTQSDVFVYLHRRKLLFGGDVILNKQNAIIMGKGDPEGYLKAFDYLSHTFDIEHVVPGHGEAGGKEVILNFDRYFKDMKLAAEDGSQKDALVAKYKDWNGIPLFMSPEATVRAFKKKKD